MNISQMDPDDLQRAVAEFVKPIARIISFGTEGNFPVLTYRRAGVPGIRSQVIRDETAFKNLAKNLGREGCAPFVR
jgi:hypothetical protein